MSFRHIELHKGEIRLGTILPGTWPDGLKCSLIPHQISQTRETPYKALSYVWGSPNVTETIQLNDESYKITINLACALRHIRLIDKPIRIWIDSLCIDQTNLEEKQQQIQIMREIYSKSQEVLVFLGDGLSHRIPKSYHNRHLPPSISFKGDASDRTHLQEFQDSWQECGTRRTWSPFLTMAFIRLLSLFGEPDWTRADIEVARPEVRQELFEMLRDFTVARWWRRIWVVQEVVVPQRIILHWGHVTAPWEMFVRAAQKYASCAELGHAPGIETDHLKILSHLTTQILYIESHRKGRLNEEPPGLLALLQQFSDREATNPRDKVYALLGLARQANLITPNYSMSVGEVYKRTTVSLIQDGGSLACLSGDLKRNTSTAFPSWVPDWTHVYEKCDGDRLVLQDVYSACSGWRVAIFDKVDSYWDYVGNQLDILIKSLENSGATPRRIDKQIRQDLTDYVALLQDSTRCDQSEQDSVSTYLEFSRQLIARSSQKDNLQYEAVSISNNPRPSIEAPSKEKDAYALQAFIRELLEAITTVSSQEQDIHNVLDYLKSSCLGVRDHLQARGTYLDIPSFCTQYYRDHTQITEQHAELRRSNLKLMESLFFQDLPVDEYFPFDSAELQLQNAINHLIRFFPRRSIRFDKLVELRLANYSSGSPQTLEEVTHYITWHLYGSPSVLLPKESFSTPLPSALEEALKPLMRCFPGPSVLRELISHVPATSRASAAEKGSYLPGDYPHTLRDLIYFIHEKFMTRLKTLNGIVNARCYRMHKLVTLMNQQNNGDQPMIQEEELFPFSTIILEKHDSHAQRPLYNLGKKCEVILEKHDSLHVQRPLYNLTKEGEALPNVTFRKVGLKPQPITLFDPPEIQPLHKRLEFYRKPRKHRKTRTPKDLMDTLHTESRFISKVTWCGEKLTSWDEPHFSLVTLGQWMNSLEHEAIGMSFLRTLVGGIYETNGTFTLVTMEHHTQLRQWFLLKLLPRIQDYSIIDATWWAKALGLSSSSQEAQFGSSLKDFNREMVLSTEGRVLFLTDRGSLGLGPASMNPGDEVHILPGGRTHFILRPDSSLYENGERILQLIGDCFLDTGVSDTQKTGHPGPTVQGGLPRELLEYIYAKRGIKSGISRITIK